MLFLRSLFAAVLELPKQILFLNYLFERVFRGKTRVLKGLSRLELYFNLQYGMMMELIAFLYNYTD